MMMGVIRLIMNMNLIIKGEQPMNKEQKIQELTERIEKSQAEIDELKEELDKLQKKPYEISYPKDGAEMYYIDDYTGELEEKTFYIWNDGDKHLYDIGLLFDTEEEAKQFKRERALIKKIKCWAKEQQGDWQPDWGNIDQCKHYIDPNCLTKEVTWSSCWVQDKLPKLPYFKSKEIVRACIDEFGDEILEVFC